MEFTWCVPHTGKLYVKLENHMYVAPTSPQVDGLLVQLPFPPHIDEKAICNAVAPDKDVDGFHILNIGKFTVYIYVMFLWCE